MSGFDFHGAPLHTPCYIVFEQLLKKNLETLSAVKKRTGCKILLAQKGFSMYRVYPLIARYLDGTTASSLFEARLGAEEMGGECHIFAPAYRPDELDEILAVCNHIVCNSYSQWELVRSRAKGKHVSCGIRVNPEYAEVETALYNPCGENSRLGVTLREFERHDWTGIEGIHFHTMCEQDSDTLERTLKVFDGKFGKYLRGLKWVNFGGGHHITRPGYDIERLCRCVTEVSGKYGVTVYLEPGEAIALNTGFLVSTVLDIVENGKKIAILDTSAACHMPDVLEMPYRPNVIGAGAAGEKHCGYILGCPTCLAGDVIGEYSFDAPLQPGNRLVFCDMSHYTMVKNNTFNGIGLPAIYLLREDGTLEAVRKFGYEDFKSRLS